MTVADFTERLPDNPSEGKPESKPDPTVPPQASHHIPMAPQPARTVPLVQVPVRPSKLRAVGRDQIGSAAVFSARKTDAPSARPRFPSKRDEISSPDGHVDPCVGSPATAQAESALTREIAELWHSQRQRQAAMRLTRAELSKTRMELAERLHTYKLHLVGSGREGKWSPFLRELSIPRATADRLINNWQNSSDAPKKCLTEAVPPTMSPKRIASLVKTLSLKLAKELTTRESVAQFVSALAIALEVPTSH